MASVRLLSVTFLGLIARPTGILVVLGLMSAWPLLLVLAPIGISTSNIGFGSLSFELAIVGGLAGVILGGESLARLRPLLALEPAGLQLQRELLVLVALGAAGSVTSMLPGLCMGRLSPSDLSTIVVRGAAPALLATAGASILLARLKLPPWAATWLLVSGILLAPATWPQSIPAQAMILLAASFTSAAWLIDHLPAGPR